MGIVNDTYLFIDDNETVTKTKLNDLAGPLVTEFNGNISNDNIASDAAINVTKIAVTSQAEGDMMIFSGGSWTRLAKGTASQFLKMDSSGDYPEWSSS